MITAAEDRACRRGVAPSSFARWFGGKDGQAPLDSPGFIAQSVRAWNMQLVLPTGPYPLGGEFLAARPHELLDLTMADFASQPKRATNVVAVTATQDDA